MSSDIIIKVDGLSKCYQIYDQPQDRLKQFISSRLQRLIKQTHKQYYQEFWALNDVSFEVKKGETVGIIGANGSGKSTLLQLVCGILTPTSGSITTHGRIAALLELGSGFNSEFTGRENVYMYAAVLGLSKEEVDYRFADIAAFADIGSFMEQPVKTYSSGMYVRLAFAVIAHVDAEILVIDEALSVGDAIFTQKCMRFIRAFQEKGSLLFVSHDMGSIASLCQRAIWLDQGRKNMLGGAQSVSQAYLQHTLQGVYGQDAQLQTVGSGKELSIESDQLAVGYESCYNISQNLTDANGFSTGEAEITNMKLENLSNPGEKVLKGGEKVRLSIWARTKKTLDSPILGFVFHDRLGQALFGENTLPFTDCTPVSVKEGGAIVAHFTFLLPMLPNGDYVVFASIAEGQLYNNMQHHLLHDALIVKVSSSKIRWGLVGIPFERIELETC